MLSIEPLLAWEETVPGVSTLVRWGATYKGTRGYVYAQAPEVWHWCIKDLNLSSSNAGCEPARTWLEAVLAVERGMGVPRPSEIPWRGWKYHNDCWSVTQPESGLSAVVLYDKPKSLMHWTVKGCGRTVGAGVADTWIQALLSAQECMNTLHRSEQR